MGLIPSLKALGAGTAGTWQVDGPQRRDGTFAPMTVARRTTEIAAASHWLLSRLLGLRVPTLERLSNSCQPISPVRRPAAYRRQRSNQNQQSLEPPIRGLGNGVGLSGHDHVLAGG